MVAPGAALRARADAAAPGIVLLGVPGCGGLRTVYNLLSATAIGFIVAGGAWVAAGRDHA